MRHRAALAIVLAGAATALLADVRRRRTRRFDLSLLASVRGRGPRTLRKLGDFFDQPGALLAQSTAIGLFVAVARKNPRAGASIFAAPALALAVSEVVKHAFCRARPPSHFFQRKGMQSFPSSHTAGKGALLAIMVSALPARRWVRVLASIAAGADLALVGVTRVAEGAHWPTDALAGAAIGIASAETTAILARAR